MTDGPAARRLLDAITSRDFASVEAALAAGAHMRALLPSGLVEVTGRDAIAERLRAWFGGANPFEVLSATAEPVAHRYGIGYRFRLRPPGARLDTVIEQHLFCTAENGAVEAIDLLCTGFLPLATAGETHEFDAGTLGCADGLAGEFKQRIREVGVGDLLRVHTVDPAAKEDLPSLARLMGHTIRSVEAYSDGSLTITVERGR